MAFQCAASMDMTGPSCEHLMTEIPSECMTQIVDVMFYAQSLPDLCEKNTSSVIFDPRGLVFSSIRCVMQSPTIQQELAPFFACAQPSECPKSLLQYRLIFLVDTC